MIPIIRQRQNSRRAKQPQQRFVRHSRCRLHFEFFLQPLILQPNELALEDGVTRWA